MPEYLAPGVFVEETSFRAKSIQGVGTSTTAFVGPTRKGPVGMVSDVITSYGEFERIYGGLRALDIGGTMTTNYVAHGVKAFFDNGGGRLYMARTFTARSPGGGTGTLANNSASAEVPETSADDADSVGTFRARSPGAGLNGIVIAHRKLTPATATTLNAAPTGSMAQTGAAGSEVYYVKGADGVWNIETPAGDGSDVLDLENVPSTAQLVTLNIEMRPGVATVNDAPEGGVIVVEGLGLGTGHPRRLADALPQNPSSRGARLSQAYWFEPAGGATPFSLRRGLFLGGESTTFTLTGGLDGAESVTTDTSANSFSYEEALALMEEVSDIAIIAAPGSSAGSDMLGVQQRLISHAERMKYRIAVLDTDEGVAVGTARETRAALDSKHAALYYPWVVVSNPAARPSNDAIDKEIALPPSGFMCGIYARNDVQRGVWKAPANEVVRGALRFEREISKGEQEVLNPEGVNCLRSFFGRGNRVWGARTVSSDPEWIYLNVRRYFNYVEHSIDRSTQWAVFEPNGPALWSNITDTISSFLFAEWRSGALLGANPEEAYFVRCDRSTMTQADLDNGRLICEIGIAVLKPAEFVIFRIGQKTADAQG